MRCSTSASAMTDPADRWPYRLLRTRHGACGLIILVAHRLRGACSGPRSHRTIPTRSASWRAFTPPARGHWFGADEFGRDVLSRILVGARETSGTAVTATCTRHAVRRDHRHPLRLSRRSRRRSDHAHDRCCTGDSRTAAGAADRSTLGKGSFETRCWPSLSPSRRHGADHAQRGARHAAAGLRQCRDRAWRGRRLDRLPRNADRTSSPRWWSKARSASPSPSCCWQALSFLGLGAQPPAPEWGLMIAEGRGIPAPGAVDDRRPRRGHRLHRDRFQLGRRWSSRRA